MTRRRVAITGLGAITPVGHDAPSFWESLVAGRSGVAPLTLVDAKLGVEGLRCKIGAEVKGFDPKAHFAPKVARHIERFTMFAMVASREAWRVSGLEASGLPRERVGCVLGVGIGGVGYLEESCRTLLESGPGRISPFLIPRIIPNAAPANVAIDIGLRGPNFTVVTACAAGTNAIGEAAGMIRHGQATAMLAGGAEAALCSVAVFGFDRMRALCSDFNEAPERGSRPFDVARCGFVPGEGAGVLVLEEWEHARARGAPILAELTGYGNTCDAYHITAPAEDAEGGTRAMRLALEDAGLNPDQVGYVNAHGTSTDLNDRLETLAIKNVFGDHARNLPISSNKSMIGHLLGAAGGVEAVATVLSLRDRVLPPTINLDNPAPECDLDYVPNVAREAPGLRHAISNSLGFGGHNSVIAISRVED